MKAISPISLPNRVNIWTDETDASLDVELPFQLPRIRNVHGHRRDRKQSEQFFIIRIGRLIHDDVRLELLNLLLDSFYEFLSLLVFQSSWRYRLSPLVSVVKAHQQDLGFQLGCFDYSPSFTLRHRSVIP